MLDYKTTIFGSPRTMLGYAVVIRALPVALVVGSMVAATAIGLRAVRALRMMQGSCTSWYRFGTKKDVKKGYIKFSEEDSGGDEAAGDGGNGGGGALDEEQGGTVGVDDVGLYLSEQAGAGLDKEGGASQSFLEEEHSLLRTVEFEDVLSDNPEIGGPRDYEHDVRVGRPNIEALVKAAVAGMKQERPPTTGQRRRLVVAACGPSEMVETARKAVADCRRSCRCEHVRVEFSGAEWQW